MAEIEIEDVLTEDVVQETPKAKVTASVSATVNTGNYENVKPMAAVSIECNDDPAEVALAFDRAWEIVEEQLARKVKEARAAGK